MTIYSSTTLAELLDQLDMRAPDLAAPIRERVETLEGERDDLQQELDAAPESCSECKELESDLEAHVEYIADLKARIKELGGRIMKLATRIWFLSLTLLIPFALVAFVRWEMHPGEWPMGARYIAAWLVLVAVVIHAAAPRVTK